METAAAVLKSAANSVRGFVLSKVDREALRRIKRALKRGLGPPRRAKPVSPGDLLAIYRASKRPQEKMRANAYILAGTKLVSGSYLEKKFAMWQLLMMSDKRGSTAAFVRGMPSGKKDLLAYRREQGAQDRDPLVGDLFGTEADKAGLREVLRCDLTRRLPNPDSCWPGPIPDPSLRKMVEDLTVCGHLHRGRPNF
ncbi:hypothetical protein FOL47_006729 [Perkinsus chesapeaki]|uniref:Uncharacterized protein n=1 Tax=Perkinsus chesapeaki TaxID=330153 RepID=A0A7J6LPY7_PERCH|nr:hypothetical protein FOL47_006729 [Perkinsus chesapeaki]